MTWQPHAMLGYLLPHLCSSLSTCHFSLYGHSTPFCKSIVSTSSPQLTLVLLPQLNAWVQCLLSAPIMKSWRGTIDWPSLSFHPSIYQAQYLKPQSQFIRNDDACNCLILPLKRHRLKGLMHYLFAHVPVMQTSDITYETWMSPRFLRKMTPYALLLLWNSRFAS